MKKLNKLFSNKILLSALISVCIVLIIAGIGLYAAFQSGLISGDGDFFGGLSSAFSRFVGEDKDEGPDDGELQEPVVSAESEGELTIEPEPVEAIPVVYSFPDRMMAVTLAAGSDFYTSESLSASEIRDEINASIDYAVSISANTLFVDLKYGEKVIFSSGPMPQVNVSFDMLSYICEKAREKNLYVYAVFDVLNVSRDGKTVISGTVDPGVIDIVKTNAKAVAAYDLDGIMLDCYSIPNSAEAYSSYIENGLGYDYDSYLGSSAEMALDAAFSTVRNTSPEKSIGIAVDAVWANAGTAEGGSDTEADYESLADGHADTRSFVNDGEFDFVAVKSSYSTTNKNAKFETYFRWWADSLTRDVPLYIFQYSSKACTDEKGWSDPSELSDQVILSEKVDAFSGSIFDSLKALKANPKQSTDALIQYLTENIDPSFLLTQLEITKPSKSSFATYESVVVFAGASDVNFELTMNGKEVKRDSNGAFMLTIDLSPGQNTFKFEHKEKTIIYNVTRNVKVLQEISPMGNVTINGGMSMTVTAVAYENSVVTATLNGTSFTLTPSETADDSTNNESTYKTYTGSVTVPAATTSEQALGNIKVTGSWQGSFTETVEGAFVTVAAKATSGSLVEVTARSAETFPTSTLNDLSDYDCYPLCRGTMDYTEGDEIVYVEGSNSYSYYNLSSGQRVYTKDVKVISGDIGGNTISNMSVSSNSRYTYVSFETAQHVPYVAKYSKSAFTIEFLYTESVPAGLSLHCTPLFSSASWSGTKLSLELSTSGGFLGYYAYYDGDTLVFRFNNPTGTSRLKGVPIVVDVGHSQLGVGALGFLSAYGEYEINLSVCKKLKSELEDRGATVYMMDTVNQRPSLQERVSYASGKNPLIFVSIHCNSSTSSTGNGSECYYFTRFTSSFASKISSGVASALETTDRGAQIGRYYVTRIQEYPAVLAELGFVSNESDYYKLIQNSYQNDIVDSIADAIQSFLGSVGKNGSYDYGSQSTGGSSYSAEDAPEDEYEDYENDEDDEIYDD